MITEDELNELVRLTIMQLKQWVAEQQFALLHDAAEALTPGLRPVDFKSTATGE